ncbi:MAG TPA: S16 family serine protease [Jatrophihabitans sp.]|jgi:PDZ domain-containing protein|uniref:YlbL family protein n=1 Tax=Jatrophihabitans sp. TaxID=1932789 RepID=UPI002EEEB249
MSRQLRTLIFGAVLCLVLGILSFGLQVPYLVESPGPTFNTLGKDDGKDIIAISGHPVTPTSGHLNLTTVSADTQKTTVLGAVRGWLRNDEVVVPHDSLYPPGTSQEQQNEQNSQDFLVSQQNAVEAAACELGYPEGLGVNSVSKDSPNTALKAGDQFVSVDRTPIADDTALRKVLNAHRVGDRLPAVMRRAGKQVEVTLLLQAPAAESDTPRIGITIVQGCLPPFQITLSLTGIGGPSAGLMFSLGIIDKISAEDLTRGRFIAGTGTIDSSGKVGPIGGIALKMIAARRAGATVFLAPADNCLDVDGNIPSGLDVIRVATLDEAIDNLKAHADGGPVARC